MSATVPFIPSALITLSPILNPVQLMHSTSFGKMFARWTFPPAVGTFFYVGCIIGGVNVGVYIGMFSDLQDGLPSPLFSMQGSISIFWIGSNALGILHCDSDVFFL